MGIANTKTVAIDGVGEVAADPGLDAELLGDVIQAVEDYLESQGKVPDARLKPRAIGLLHLHFRESEKPEKKSTDTIKPYLKLVV